MRLTPRFEKPRILLPIRRKLRSEPFRSAAITLQSALAAAAKPPPRPAGDPIADPWRVIWAFLSGKLRRQFYADTAAFSESPDATRQIGAGYVCLAGAVGWVVSGIMVAALDPANIASHVLTVVNTLGCYYGFSRIRNRQDPRPTTGLLVILAFITIAIMSYFHTGLLAPCVAALPVATGLAAFYLQGTMRRLAYAVGLAVVAFCYLTSRGVIGEPTTYTPGGYAAMSFISLVLAMICLAGVAWIANMSRDYAIERLEAASGAIVESAARSHVAMEAAKVGLWDVPNADLRRFHDRDRKPFRQRRLRHQPALQHFLPNVGGAAGAEQVDAVFQLVFIDHRFNLRSHRSVADQS